MFLLNHRALGLRRRSSARLVRAWSKRVHHPARAGRRVQPSKLVLDLFTPFIWKDADVFRHTVEKARQHLRHPLGTHYVVGPSAEAAKIRVLCRELGCEFVEEESVLGYGADRLKPYFANLKHCRAGWAYQQLLKLNADRVARSDAVLVLDADTIFVSDMAFERDGRFLLQYSEGYMECYDATTMRILGLPTLNSLSFVCHHMLMRGRLLEQLRADIESRHGARWDEAVMKGMESGSDQPLSEYEIYGNFAMKHWPQEHRLEYWFNLSLAFEDDMDLMSVLKRCGEDYRTVSLHSYRRKRSGSARGAAQPASVA